MADINQMKCPCCGGTLEFDSETQHVTCPYCDAEFEAKDLASFDADLNEKYEEQIVWDKEIKEAWSDDPNVNVYVCDSCGGEIICGENTSATICPYCGNNVLIKSKLSGDLKPEIIIPFKISKEESAIEFKKFFRKKIFMPRHFKKYNKITDSNSMYVPYWIYSADVDGHIKYDGEKTRTWSDSNYNYRETSYYKLIRCGNIGFDNVPVDASKKMPDDLMESIEPFNSSDHKEFRSAYLAGYTAERYDVSKDENQVRANTRFKEGTIDAFRKTIHGYSNVNYSTGAFELSNQSAKYALYPIWMLNISWKENQYTFAVNGDTGKVAGKYPISKLRVFLFILITTILFLGGMFGMIYAFTQSVEDSLIFGVVFGLVATLITNLVTLLPLRKRVALKRGSADYYRDGSMKIYESRDIFLYKKVSRTRRSESSSSSKKR